jgi:hypothetical protein
MNPDSATMPPPELPLELLLMIAHHMRGKDGELRYGDFNSFLQVNRALYACLNPMLWEEAMDHEVGTQRVFTDLIGTNKLAGLEYFHKLGVDVEVRLPVFSIAGLYGDPTPLLVTANSDDIPLARLFSEQGAKVQYLGRESTGKFTRCMVHDRPRWCNCSWTTTPTPSLVMSMNIDRNDITAMRAILQRDAEVNPITPFGKPIHEAAQRSLAAVKLLVKHRADVQETDVSLNTPLRLAAAAGKIQVVKFLVESWLGGQGGTQRRWEDTTVDVCGGVKAQSSSRRQAEGHYYSVGWPVLRDQ